MRLFLMVTALLFSGLIYGQKALLKQKKSNTNKRWGKEISGSPSSDIKVRVGSRLQSIAELSDAKLRNIGESVKNQDMYLRRIRFQFETVYKNDWRYFMDIRNDNANKSDKGDGQFSIGDAYIQRKSILGIKGLSSRLFRSKVEVSRTQTISSAKLIHLERAYISDEAAGYVSDGRRATNFQLNGDFDQWHFQVVLGDGIQSDSMSDARGNDLSGGEVSKQKLLVGTHISIFPITGWKDDQPRETYFGKGKHLSFGGGVFHTGSIKYRVGSDSSVNSVGHTLLNGQMSFHYKKLFFQSEYFKFNGVIENLSSTIKNIGSSSGFYSQAEYYLLPKLDIATFLRYENWDRFDQREGYDLESLLIGLNWYYLKNKIRFGLSWQRDKYGPEIRESFQSSENISQAQRIRFTSMWHF